MVFHPDNTQVIYIGTKGEGLWVSDNGGDSWLRVVDIKGILKSDAEIYSIAVSRTHPATFYLAVFQDKLGRVIKSEDGGRSFSEVYKVSADRFGVFGVAIDPFASNRAYIATGQGGFFESSDAGKSWRVQKWFPDGIVRLVANPSNGAEYYVVSTHGEMFRTDDRGLSWVRLTEGYRSFKNAYKMTDLTLDPLNPAIVYMASPYGLLRSQNSGKTWSAVPLTIPPGGATVATVTVSPQNSSQILAGVGSRIHKSIDGGETWQEIQLPTSGNITMLRVLSGGAGEIYAVSSK